MRSMFVKLFAGLLLFSFPVTLYFLIVADGKQTSGHTPVGEIVHTIEKRQKDLAVLDEKILEARGQMMKFEDMKKDLVKDLFVLKQKISDVIARSKNDASDSQSSP